MQVLSFEAISSARPLLFKIGPKKREFFIHSALVASLSPSLKQLVDGPWAESTSGVVEWEHVDEATFVHFCQFAYTTSYNVQQSPSVRPVLKGSNELPLRSAPQPDQEVQDDDWGIPLPRTKKKKKPKFDWFDEEEVKEKEIAIPFAAQFQSVLQQVLEKQPSYLSLTPITIPDKLGVTMCYSYSEIFLAHVRVFLFADYHQIDNLSNQALGSLRRSFMNCQAKNSDVIEVTEFCVNEDLPDRLRELVLAYIASQATRMWDEPRFKELLQQDSGMTFDLLNIIMEAAKA